MAVESGSDREYALLNADEQISLLLASASGYRAGTTSGYVWYLLGLRREVLYSTSDEREALAALAGAQEIAAWMCGEGSTGWAK